METQDENTRENQQTPPTSNWGAVKVVKVELEFRTIFQLLPMLQIIYK